MPAIRGTCDGTCDCKRDCKRDSPRLRVSVRLTRFSPGFHKEYRLAGSSFLSLSLRPNTQLSLKMFETACASGQLHFPAFLIVDTKAFQPDERQLQQKLMLNITWAKNVSEFIELN